MIDIIPQANLRVEISFIGTANNDLFLEILEVYSSSSIVVVVVVVTALNIFDQFYGESMKFMFYFTPQKIKAYRVEQRN